nr:YnbE family lipoprotein [Desulfobulbaceae bacterium]
MVFCSCFLIFPGCTRHTIESKHEVTLQPVEIKPIHITIDVNIKVDRALDDFFGDIDKAQ